MSLPKMSKTKKADLIWMQNNNCLRHGRPYIEHYECYLTEVRPPERIGFLDIETSNLAANFGVMFAYCIKKSWKNEILFGITEPKTFKKDLDKEIVEKCVSDMKQFDRLVTFYGTKFDIPFIRTRALSQGVSFPGYGEILHTDLYYMVRNKLRQNSNRLETTCRTVFGKTHKTHIENEYWIRALMSDKESLEYILDHCKNDVLETERLFNVMTQFTGALTNRSI